MGQLGSRLHSLHREALDRANKSCDGTSPPGQRCAVHPASKRVQVAGDGRRDHPACCTGTGRKSVHFAQDGRTRCRLLNQDQKKRVDDDGEDIPDRQAKVDRRVKHGFRDPDEEGHDEACDRVKNCDEQEKTKDANLLCSDREDDGLYEQGDSSINSHNHANCVHGKAETTREVKKSGNVGQAGERDSIVFEKDGKEMIVAHCVVGL